ncbi:MAG TPA: secretin N-terminal domain-containing protein [Longimicrobiales bacterium]|nr:secretin N-terminal domain-containing protein [Longimicrobiales bacterium]
MRRLRDVALATVLAMALSSPLSARQVEPAPGGGVVLNFREVQLSQALEALAQAVGVNIVLTAIPQIPITLRTSQPVSLDEARDLLYSLARANGIFITESAGFLRLHGAAQDVPPGDLRELYIYRLRHARAGVLAATLQALFGGPALGPAVSGGGAGTTLSQRLQALEQQAAAVGGGGQPTTAPGTVIIQAGPGSGELEAPVQIVPDDVTNSLLIRATAADWLVIEQALSQLDLRPLQVVIEVIIAEVTRSDDYDVGINWFAEDPNPSAGDITEGGIDRETPDGAFTLRLVRTGTINVEATLHALSALGNVRILSRPIIHAQNNQEASILVGSQRPFIAISRTLPDNAVRDDVVQYLNVGTSLTILPTINEDGYVNMLVTQEVSSATTETQFGAPVISTREASTQLLARNGQTVVIGGLVDRQEERTRAGIPILKDIPVLGWLFGHTRIANSKSELFLFLTPYIVATDEDANRVREEIEARSELLGDFAPVDPILPDVPENALPVLPPPPPPAGDEPAAPEQAQ